MKQVSKSHYEFSKYINLARWSSLWYQLNEAFLLRPANVLEIGPGPGLFKTVGSKLGLSIETLDLDPELGPDHLCSVTQITQKDNTYDLVCAFQMLEHLPYENALRAFSEMVRVCKRNVIISLPDAKPMWRYRFHLPKVGVSDFLVSKPLASPIENRFDGEHYWEINKKGFALSRVIGDFTLHCTLLKTFRVLENPYHRFFIFEKSQQR